MQVLPRSQISVRRQSTKVLGGLQGILEVDYILIILIKVFAFIGKFMLLIYHFMLATAMTWSCFYWVTEYPGVLGWSHAILKGPDLLHFQNLGGITRTIGFYPGGSSKICLDYRSSIYSCCLCCFPWLCVESCTRVNFVAMSTWLSSIACIGELFWFLKKS